MTTRRPEIPYLIAAVVLAVAACTLVGLHDTLPQFLPLAIIGLLAAGAGVTLPTSLAIANTTPAPVAAPAAAPVAIANTATPVVAHSADLPLVGNPANPATSAPPAVDTAVTF